MQTDTLNMFERIEQIEKDNPEGTVVRLAKDEQILQGRLYRPAGHTHVKLFGRCLHEYVEDGFTIEKVSD